MAHTLVKELQQTHTGHRHERVILRGGIHLLYWWQEDAEGVESEFVTTLAGRDASFFSLTEQEWVELYMQAKEAATEAAN